MDDQISAVVKKCYFHIRNISKMRLQTVQNSAARLILCIRKSAYITPAFIKLDWLPIDYRLKFKIFLQIF